jgi:hypothetical protein
MAKKGPGAGQSTDSVAPSEADLAQVTPRDLYPTSDIRFVLVELGKINSEIKNLVEETKKHTTKFDEVGGKIHNLEKVIHGFYVAGAVLAVVAVGFWWLEGERITAVLKPASAVAASVSPSAAVPNTTP